MMRVAIRTVADSNNTISADCTGISKCAVGRDGVVRGGTTSILQKGPKVLSIVLTRPKILTPNPHHRCSRSPLRGPAPRLRMGTIRPRSCNNTISADCTGISNNENGRDGVVRIVVLVGRRRQDFEMCERAVTAIVVWIGAAKNLVDLCARCFLLNNWIKLKMEQEHRNRKNSMEIML